MPVEIGKVVDGTVTGITNFGAFIQLPDGETGLCHISEIADEYVKDVKDYLKEQQKVKVKIIEVSGSGKVSLSIRKAIEKTEEVNDSPKVNDKPRVNNSPRPSNSSRTNNNSKPNNNSRAASGSRREGFSHSSNRSSSAGFEDMLSKFLKDSDDKLKDMKKSINKRRGNGFNRRES